MHCQKKTSTWTFLVLVFALLTGGILKAGSQPAPRLTSVQVYAVASQQSPYWEYGPFQISTRNDHGGSWLWVATKELGYAIPSSRIARFNGVRMTWVGEQYVLQGNLIVGFYEIWQYTGKFTSGQFQYQATSEVVPYSTLSTSLQIR